MTVWAIAIGAIPVTLLASNSRKGTGRELLKLGAKSARNTKSAASTVAVMDRKNRCVIIVTVPKQKRSAASLAGLCAHEASHAIDMALDFMREPKAGEEIRAYLSQYLTEVLFGVFK